MVGGGCRPEDTERRPKRLGSACSAAYLSQEPRERRHAVMDGQEGPRKHAFEVLRDR